LLTPAIPTPNCGSSQELVARILLFDAHTKSAAVAWVSIDQKNCCELMGRWNLDLHHQLVSPYQGCDQRKKDLLGWNWQIATERCFICLTNNCALASITDLLKFIIHSCMTLQSPKI
jgi:hypothetical protein